LRDVIRGKKKEGIGTRDRGVKGLEGKIMGFVVLYNL
jgi:hypothetical protein